MLKEKIMDIDIETIPDPDCPKELWPTAPLGTATKPETIEKKEIEFEQSGARAKAMATNPMMCKIVSLQYLVGGELVSPRENDEVKALKEWSHVARTAGIKQFWGHYIFTFDIPAIIWRCMINGVELPFPINLKRYTTKPVCDTAMILTEWGNGKTRYLKFETMLKHIRINAEKLGDGSMVYPAWQMGNFDWIHDYCIGDIRPLPQVREKLRGYMYNESRRTINA